MLKPPDGHVHVSYEKRQECKRRIRYAAYRDRLRNPAREAVIAATVKAIFAAAAARDAGRKRADALDDGPHADGSNVVRFPARR
jgi:hypothetical protein